MSGKTLKEWLSEGEHLHAAALQEFHQIEAQIEELEQRLAVKKDEVNQIAHVIGKPTVESNRRLTAELIDDRAPNSVPNNPNTIARALSGRTLGR